MSSSGIPPNLAGSIFQAQVSSAETAKSHDTQKNKRAADSRRLAQLADQQQHEVEDTDHAEGLHVHREDERPRDGSDARDTYERQKPDDSKKLYNPNQPAPEPTPPDSDQPGQPDQPDPPDHIDLSA
jgi:hypothetical protein